MSVAIVSSKGQITIPSGARQSVGIKAHDAVLIETRGGEIVIRPTAALMQLQGFLGRALAPAEERLAMAKRIATHTRRRS
jgi:AbrB family looped-hinge helix DNA binding protein